MHILELGLSYRGRLAHSQRLVSFLRFLELFVQVLGLLGVLQHILRLAEWLSRIAMT